MSENGMLMRIFCPKSKAVERRRKLHDEELHNNFLSNEYDFIEVKQSRYTPCLSLARRGSTASTDS